MNCNRYFIATLWLLALSVSACHDSVVDLTPVSDLTEANFYNTSQDINNAVLGIYDHYQGKITSDWMVMEYPTDHLHNSEYAAPNGLDQVGEFDFDPSNDRFRVFWQNAYNGIYRANSVLENIDVPEDYLENEREQYEGEARFMRALYYFDLVRAFGGVPEITTRVSVEEGFNTPRASEEQIYSLIIDDLEYAVDFLPSPTEASLGRANEAAAAALLGKVYVYLEDWNNALTYLEQVEGHGYELEEDFAMLFSLDGAENNDEFIFQMPYLELDDGQSLSHTFIPYLGVEGISTTGGETALISWSLHKKFDDNDTRKDVTITEYWRVPDSGDDLVWYPYVSKFAVPHTGSSSGLDLPVIRYAEVVLLRAEALYHTGNEAEALAELNRIRERAFADDSQNYADASDFMDKLMEERQLELAFENERWFDLVRTGRFMDELAVHEKGYNPETGEAVTATYDIQPHQARFPIPQHEIDQALPDVLEQNEGY